MFQLVSFFTYPIIAIIALFVGSLIFLVFYLIFDMFILRSLKKRTPKDEKELAKGSKPLKLVRKEVEEKEEIDRHKQREFDKLRRIAERELDIAKRIGNEGNNGNLQEGGVLSDGFGFKPAGSVGTDKGISNSQRRTIKIPIPTDIRTEQDNSDSK